MAPAPPFSPDVIDEDRRYPQQLHPAGLKTASTLLRTSPEAWQVLAAGIGVPARGAFSVELAVVVLPDGTAVTNGSSAERERLLRAATSVLCREVTSDRAMYLAKTLVDDVLKVNRRAQKVVFEAMADPEALTCTLRLVIKHLVDVRVGMKASCVWFPTTHANGYVLDKRTKTIAVLEPSLASCMPCVVDAVRRAWSVDGYSILATDAEEPAPIVDLALCTIAAAIHSLVVVDNSPETQRELDALVNYVHDHQHWLIRLLVRSLLRPVSMTVPTPVSTSMPVSDSTSASAADDEGPALHADPGPSRRSNSW